MACKKLLKFYFNVVTDRRVDVAQIVVDHPHHSQRTKPNTINIGKQSREVYSGVSEKGVLQSKCTSRCLLMGEEGGCTSQPT